jgi:hypothetical protein
LNNLKTAVMTLYPRRAKKKGSTMSKHPQVLSDAEVRTRFGTFAWAANGNSSITIKGDWVERNIIKVFIPALEGVQTFGGKFGGRFSWHRSGAEQLIHALAAKLV